MHRYIPVESDTSVTAKETKKLIACLELHSRLMGEWGSQFLPLLLFSLSLFACWGRYAGQMPREMWCIIHSSYSLGFPWWEVSYCDREVRSRSWNNIPKLFKICTHAQDSLCWWFWLCLHVCVCSGKQPTVTVPSSISYFRMEYPGKDSASCFMAPLRSQSMWQELFPELGFHQWPQHRGTVRNTSKPKLWLPCLLTNPTTCSCKLIICGRSGVQPLGFAGGDSLQAEEPWDFVWMQFTPCCFPGQVHLLGLALWITLLWDLSLVNRGRDCSGCRCWSCKGHIVGTYLHSQKSQTQSSFEATEIYLQLF